MKDSQQPIQPVIIICAKPTPHAASGMTHNAPLAKVVKVARDSRIRSGAVTDPADASTKETRRGMKHEGIIADAAEPLPQNG